MAWSTVATGLASEVPGRFVAGLEHQGYLVRCMGVGEPVGPAAAFLLQPACAIGRETVKAGRARATP